MTSMICNNKTVHLKVCRVGSNPVPSNTFLEIVLEDFFTYVEVTCLYTVKKRVSWQQKRWQLSCHPFLCTRIHTYFPTKTT